MQRPLTNSNDNTQGKGDRSTVHSWEGREKELDSGHILRESQGFAGEHGLERKEGSKTVVLNL